MTGTFRSFRTARRVPTSRRLDLELLESREVPATITVTNLLDDTNTGNGVSLREALNSINAGSAANGDVTFTGTFGTSDTVLFAAGLTGTINTTTQLSITKPVTVTGPGAASLAVANTGAASATNRVLLVDPVTGGSTVTVSGLTFKNGNSTANGGGILNQDAILRLNGVVVSNNTTTGKGGGISLPTSTAQLFLTDSKVMNNGASSDGGGVNLDSASPVTLLRSTISGNTCGDDGGALYFFSGGSLTMDNSTLSGNTCPAGTGNDGGAMYLWSVTTTIRNSTIANNTAGTGAIAIKYGYASTPLTISNSTISGNTGTSTSGSGGIMRTTTYVPVNLTSTIIAGNLGGPSLDLRDLNLINSTGITANNSLIGILPAAIAPTGTANLTGNAATPLNALLGTLADNSGTTQTMALLAGSPAIDKGSGTSADQRGFAPIGQRDIGAFEFTPTPAPPLFTSANSITFIAGTFGTFTVTTTGFPIASITRTGVLPSGVSFVNNGNGTATLSGTPALGTGGSYSLVLKATNGLLPDASQNFTLKVNQKPAFTSANSATFTAGVLGSATITTSAFPAPAISSLSNLPNGISLIDNGDGTARLTGTALVSDTYTINLTAANGVLPDSFQTFTLKVVLPPAFVTGNATTFTVGTTGSFTITAIGSPLPRVSLGAGSLPSGVTFTYNGNGIGTLAGKPDAGTAGSYNLTFVATNGAIPDATQNFTLTVVLPPPPPASPPPPTSPPPTSPPPPPPGPTVPAPTPQPSHPTPVVLVASPNSGPNGSEVRVLDIGTFNVVKTFTPFPGFSGNISTAIADMNGDGIVDYIVGAGAGGGPHVKVIDGRNGDELQSFFAFAPFFYGGVSVAAGDVNGDGKRDVIVAAGAGGGPHVKVFDGNDFSVIRSFYAYAATFTGGVNVGAADLNGDGRDEIVTGAKAGGAPHVKAFDGMALTELLSFYAFDTSFGGGVSVAGGDLNGDGKDEIIVGQGAGSTPTVRVFNGAGAQTVEFLAYAPTFTGGVNVAGADLNADGRDEIVTGAGAGGGPHVKAFDGLTQTEKFSIFATDETFHGGVLVG